MFTLDKPNPFTILELPTTASHSEIVARQHDKVITAQNDADKQRANWAADQLMANARQRLGWELFEVPDTQYEDLDWEDFAKKHGRNPIDIGLLTRDVAHPRLANFDLPALLRLTLLALMEAPEPDITVPMDHPPVEWAAPAPLEVRDVLFG